jgi:uncharacterized protein
MKPGTPIRLRPHHLLCILSYKGVGYTPGFTANMTTIVEAISNGAPILVKPGPDAICAGLMAHDAAQCHCNEAKTQQMDQQAYADLKALLPLESSFPLKPADIAALRAAFAAGSIRHACNDCSWQSFCTEIAQSGFKGTGLLAANAVASR